MVFAQFTEVGNEDVIGATPTGDARTTFQWSRILLPTKMRVMLEIWWYFSHVMDP